MSGNVLAPPPEIPEEATRALQSVTWERGLTAAGAMLAFLIGAKLVGYLIRRALSGARDWGGPVFAASRLFGYLVVAIGVVVSLGLLGVPLSSLLLTSSVLLLGIGFSLQHIAGDFVAGVILLVEQPIRTGDFITFKEAEGTVKQIGLRATHLVTRDGTNVVVPNHLIVRTEVANQSYPLKRALFTVAVPVALGEDVDRVEEILRGVCQGHPQVMAEPPPRVLLTAFRDSEMEFTLAGWIEDAVPLVRVASELRYEIARAFARTGVRYPTPSLKLVHSDGREAQ